MDRWNRLKPETRGRLLQLFVSLDGKKAERTLRDYFEALIRVAEILGDLDRPQAVANYLSVVEVKWVRKHGRAGYSHYIRLFKLPQPEYEYRTDPRRILPKIPPETTLQASISAARRLKWQAYFRLLYEAGPRPSEPFSLRVHDVDFDRDKVRLGTAKRSGYTTERELPISPLLKGMLQAMIQGRTPDAYVFTKTRRPEEPLTYKQAQDVMTKIKRQLRSAGYPVEGLRLHIYRHAFGTRIYHATKDLALTARALGHRDLKDTMIYVHVLPDQPRRYDVVHVEIGDKEKIGAQIGEGWEIALQTPDTVYFRRPRWIP